MLSRPYLLAKGLCEEKTIRIKSGNGTWTEFRKPFAETQLENTTLIKEVLCQCAEKKYLGSLRFLLHTHRTCQNHDHLMQNSSRERIKCNSWASFFNFCICTNLSRTSSRNGEHNSSSRGGFKKSGFPVFIVRIESETFRPFSATCHIFLVIDLSNRRNQRKTRRGDKTRFSFKMPQFFQFSGNRNCNFRHEKRK